MIKLTPKRLGIFLIISLAVNLFLVGMIVTAVAFHKRGGGWSGYNRPFPHFIARRSLEGDARRKVDEIWRGARPDLRRQIRAAREARRSIRRLLHADTLDKPALERAFSELRTRSEAVHTTIQTTIARVAETLNAKERKSYFRRHRWRRHRQSRRHREYRKDRDD